MIYDSLENAYLYESVHPAFPKAFAFLTECIKQAPAPGRYELDGTKLYALVQSYTTKPAEEARWEAHRRYIDIQFLLEGRELIGCAQTDHMIEPGDYNAEKDVLFFKDAESPADMPLRRGTFAILFPQDAHRPNCRDGEASDALKVVVKILCES